MTGVRALQTSSVSIRVIRGLSDRIRDARNITGADSNPPAQPFARTAEYCSSSAVDYSPWCLTNFPFGSISNPDSLPFALTNTS